MKSNSANVTPTSTDRRTQIKYLLDEIEDYTYITLENEDKYEIRKLVERIKEIF